MARDFVRTPLEKEKRTPQQVDESKRLGYWCLPEESTRRVTGGYWGGRNWNRERFCRTLYTLLYKEADGYLRPSAILERLWKNYGVNGSEVARRSGYGCFELMLKHRDFAKEVHYERVGMERGFDNLYVYHAALSDEYESLRRSLPKPVDTDQGIRACPDLYTPVNECTASRERSRQERMAKKARDEHRLNYGDSDPATDNFELLWANECETAASGGDVCSRDEVGTDAIVDEEEGPDRLIKQEEGESRTDGSRC